MKRMDVAQRLRLALDLFDAGESMMRQTFKRRYPSDSVEEIETRVNLWLSDRPGAPIGDSSGQAVRFPRARR